MKRKIFRTCFGLLLLATTLWIADQLAFSTTAAHAQTDFTCANVSEIPQIECEALVAIADTNPDSQINSSWFTDDMPCSWNGVLCFDGHISDLFLSNQNLTTLAPEIGNLTNLSLLMLEYTDLTTLPPEIGNLTNLGTLFLRFNELTTLPPEIGNLAGLTQLNLSSNVLTTLPPEIGNLAGLTQLNLSSNVLTTLPPEIGSLANLTLLQLDNNELTTLPTEISSLTNLTSFSLNNNQFTTLPAEFGDLPRQIIDQILNQGITIQGLSACAAVSEIPQIECDALVALANANDTISFDPMLFNSEPPCRWFAITCNDGHITALHLSSEGLTSLPPEIGNLTNLTALYLRSNDLTSLPPEIGSLANLTLLQLDNNELATLPTEISSLTNLTSFSLNNNQFTTLPAEFGDLPRQIINQILTVAAKGTYKKKR